MVPSGSLLSLGAGRRQQKEVFTDEGLQGGTGDFQEAKEEIVTGHVRWVGGGEEDERVTPNSVKLWGEQRRAEWGDVSVGSGDGLRPLCLLNLVIFF